MSLEALLIRLHRKGDIDRQYQREIDPGLRRSRRPVQEQHPARQHQSGHEARYAQHSKLPFRQHVVQLVFVRTELEPRAEETISAFGSMFEMALPQYG